MRGAMTILLGAMTLWSGGVDPADKPAWHTDFAAAQEQARCQKRPA